jgi:hypothetical protein
MRACWWRSRPDPILMMNDPDEAMRLTACKRAGGIVSPHELPDFVRFVAARTRSVVRPRIVSLVLDEVKGYVWVLRKTQVQIVRRR